MSTFLSKRNYLSPRIFNKVYPRLPFLLILWRMPLFLLLCLSPAHYLLDHPLFHLLRRRLGSLPTISLPVLPASQEQAFPRAFLRLVGSPRLRRISPISLPKGYLHRLPGSTHLLGTRPPFKTPCLIFHIKHSRPTERRHTRLSPPNPRPSFLLLRHPRHSRRSPSLTSKPRT